MQQNTADQVMQYGEPYVLMPMAAQVYTSWEAREFARHFMCLE